MKLFYTITCYLNVEEIGINSKLLIIPGYLAGIGCLVFMTQRTLLAFFSEQKAVTIYINRYGEQYLDLLSLIILWVISLIGLFLLLAYAKKDTQPQSQKSNRTTLASDTRPYLSMPHESRIDTLRETPTSVYANMTDHDEQPPDHLFYSSHQNKSDNDDRIIKK